MNEIILPAFDTPEAALTPLVIAAVAAGATTRPHETDNTKIIVAIPDKDEAAKFEAAIAAVLNPKAKATTSAK